MERLSPSIFGNFHRFFCGVIAVNVVIIVAARFPLFAVMAPPMPLPPMPPVAPIVVFTAMFTPAVVTAVMCRVRTSTSRVRRGRGGVRPQHSPPE